MKTKFEVIMVTFHLRLFASKICDITDEERCGYLSYLHVVFYKNDGKLNGRMKNIFFKQEKDYMACGLKGYENINE